MSKDSKKFPHIDHLSERDIAERQLQSLSMAILPKTRNALSDLGYEKLRANFARLNCYIKICFDYILPGL